MGQYRVKSNTDDQTPIPLEAAPYLGQQNATPAAQTAPTRRNRQTGEVQQQINGQWVTTTPPTTSTPPPGQADNTHYSSPNQTYQPQPGPSEPEGIDLGDTPFRQGIISGKDIFNTLAQGASRYKMRIPGSQPIAEPAPPSDASDNTDYYSQARRNASTITNYDAASSPIEVAARKFIAGAGPDTADAASSFTSPESIALMGGGKLSQAAGSLGRLGKVLMRGAGAVYAGEGAKNMYDAVSDSVPDEGSNESFLSNLSKPDTLQRLFYGGSEAAMGGAGLKGEAGTPMKQRTVPDTGGMNTGDVYKTMRDAGVDMSVGDAGQGPLARHVEDLAANTPGGAGRMSKFRSKQASQIQSAMEGLQDKFDPTGAGKDIADQGTLIQKTLENAQDVAHQNASDAFTQGMSKLFNFTTADTGDIAQAAKDLKAKLLTGEVKSLQPKQAMSILDEIGNAYGDNHNNQSMFDSVFRDRSRLMKTQFTDAQVAGEGEGVMRQMAGVMRDSLEKSAAAAGKTKEFNEGMKGWQDYLDTFGDRRSPLVQAMNQPDVSKVIDTFIGNRGSYRAVQQLQKVAPDFVNVLKREFVRRLYDTKDTGVRENFGNMQNRLLNYNKPFVESLFTPEELTQLRGLTAGAKSIYSDVNPPGSGRYMGQTASAATIGGGIGTGITAAATGHPLLGAAAIGAAGAIPVASNVASRIMTNQHLADLMMGYKDSTPPALAPPSAAAQPGQNQNQGAPPGAQTIQNPFQRTGQGLSNPARKASVKGNSQAGFATGDILTGGITSLVSKLMGDDKTPSPGALKKKTTVTRKPDKSLLELANSYNKSADLGTIKPGEQVGVDPRAPRIAEAFEAMKHDPKDEKVAASYAALGKEINAQYNHAVANGITFEPWDKEGQPYANSKEMMKDVRDNKHLYFFQGGDMPGDHPLSEKGPDGLTLNDKLRAVHDLYGHAMEGNQFGPKGEENAWLAHSQMFSKEAIPALTTETKGQNSWVNFGRHIRDVANPPAPADRPFAEQKAGLLPEEFHSRDPLKDTIDAVHWSPEDNLTELDPKRFNANATSSENKRVQAFPDQTSPMTFLGDRDVYRSFNERAITNRANRYSAELPRSQYYPWSKDPEGVIPQAMKAAADKGHYGNDAVLSYAEQIIKNKGYSGTIDDAGVIRSWDKVPVTKEIIPEKYDALLTPAERDSLKTEHIQKQFVNQLSKLPPVQEFVDAAKAGEIGRKWYERSNKAFDALTESSPDYFGEGDRQKFTDFVAALSPQQGVFQNMREALSTWKKWVDAGRPTDPKALDKLLDRNLTMAGGKIGNAIKALTGQEMWPDLDKNTYFKVPSFAQNLRGMMGAVTNDSWMGLFSGLADRPAFTRDAGYYHPISVLTREAAKTLGWKPAEAQAAIWVFTRTLAEQAGWKGTSAREVPRDIIGDITNDKLKKYADDFADIMSQDGETRSLLKKLGVNLGVLDQKLGAIGHPPIAFGAETATPDSVGQLADRIKAARDASDAANGRTVKPEEPESADEGDTSFGFGQNGGGGLDGPTSISRASTKGLQELAKWKPDFEQKNADYKQAHNGLELFDDPVKTDKAMRAAAAADISKKIAKENQPETYLAQRGGKILGAMRLDTYGAERGMPVQVDYIASHPDVILGDTEAKGIGTDMMQHAIKRAAELGVGLELTAKPSAESFYKKLGMHKKTNLGDRDFFYRSDEVQKLADRGSINGMDAYHGTQKDFENFDFGKQDLGYHFGTKQQAHFMATENGEEGNLLHVKLDIKNPAELHDTGFTDPGVMYDFLPEELKEKAPASVKSSMKEMKKFLQSQGYDGIAYDNTTAEGKGKSYVAFDPSQVTITGRSRVQPKGKAAGQK